MSTITLKSSAAYRENRKTLKEKIADYFAENLNTIVFGMLLPECLMCRCCEI